MTAPKPTRAHQLLLSAGADTAKDLVDKLRILANEIEIGEITTGVLCGSKADATYSYVQHPEMTHDRYFQDLNTWLAAGGYGRD